MTVSPRRAHDGNRQPTASNNGGEADIREQTVPVSSTADSEISDALPPTLFKMPNLNPPAPNQPLGVQPQHPVQGSAREEPPVSPVLPAQESVQPQTANEPEYLPGVPAQTARDHLTSNSSVAADSLDGFTEEPAPDPAMLDENLKLPLTPPETSPSTPGGRTWMEKVGSHALVIVMLLIVVAAALITGRNSTDPANLDDSVAALDGNELNFDLGEEVEMPSADLSAGTLDLATDSTGSDAPSASITAAAVVPEDSQGLGPAEATVAVSEDSVAFPATLSPPEPDPATASTGEAALTDAEMMAAAQPKIEVNKYFNPSVDATTVSNRTTMDEALAVPSLEDLESSTNDLGNATPATANSGVQFTKTPFDIRNLDLLKVGAEIFPEMNDIPPSN